jgi:predicted MPP superfamily phosphohydrolase
MNRTLEFIIFILIALLIYTSMHLLVYRGIVKYLTPNKGVKIFIKLFFIFSGLSFPAHVFLSRGLRQQFLSGYANVWIGVISIAFFIFLLHGILVRIFRRQSVQLTVAAIIVVLLLSTISLVNGLQNPRVKRLSVPIKGLTEKLAGFKIVQLSDIHLDAVGSKKRLRYIVDTANSLQADLIVITGDLIDSNICDEDKFCKALLELKARDGVLAVTGNHEFYAGVETFVQLAQRSNIKVLRNEMVLVAEELQVAGLDDDEGDRFSGSGPNLEMALKNYDPEKPIILLYHRPAGFAEAVQRGVDLQLSGHTHAGQIPPMDLIVWLIYKYPFGLYEHEGSFIYTTSGTGFWGPPMRLFSRSEIPLLVLKPDD